MMKIKGAVQARSNILMVIQIEGQISNPIIQNLFQTFIGFATCKILL